jgi:hypothetical protein
VEQLEALLHELDQQRSLALLFVSIITELEVLLD